MRILALTRYSRLGASSRLRTMQYLPAWEDAGIKVELAPFFDDAYLTALYSGQGRSRSVLSYFAGRLKQMLARGRPDLIWIEKEALPWMPWAFERALLPRGVPIVSDFDDAVFHRYDMHRRGSVRWLLGQKIDRVMEASALVTAGNAYLAERARAAGAARVVVVPTVVDARAYATTPHPAPDGRLRVGWIGTPQTWAELARPVSVTLAPVLERHDALFRAVGAALAPWREGSLEILPWSEADEVALIASMDIGVMPLPDTPWARGKCGYKIIQYMACGVPVIASPVGVNTEIVCHGETGYLAATEAEWQDACNILLSDASLRRRMGEAGRLRMEQRYALAPWAERLTDLLFEVAGRSRCRGRQ